jgi:hypothetical protein
MISLVTVKLCVRNEDDEERPPMTTKANTTLSSTLTKPPRRVETAMAAAATELETCHRYNFLYILFNIFMIKYRYTKDYVYGTIAITNTGIGMNGGVRRVSSGHHAPDINFHMAYSAMARLNAEQT